MPKQIEILQEGSGELVGWHDPDENRRWVQENKSRELVDKRLTAQEAVTARRIGPCG